MTDSVIQFDYSDKTHCVSIFLKANTHKETFIPLLGNICNSIDRIKMFKKEEII